MSFEHRGRVVPAGSRRRGLAWILALLPLAGAATPAQDVVLTARPGLCILQDVDARRCVMGVELAWRGPPAEYCLYSSVAPAPLHCWETAAQGEWHTRLDSGQDVAYWLQRPRVRERLAQVTVRVLSLPK